MRLTERIYLVGSGSSGFDMTDAFDCHVYLIDGGSELALIDVGAGMGAAGIIENVKREGFDPARIRHVVLTHGHGDHAGGAARMRKLLGEPAIYASGAIADSLRQGDEKATSVDVAKQAGIYPLDYRLEPCPVDHELEEGATVEVGSLRFTVLDTPGHSDGHVSLLLEDAGRTTLFAGDVIFFGGKILLQNIHDCRLDALSSSLRKLRQLEVHTLFPGHLTLSLKDGQRHIERANQVLDRLLIPEQMVSAW
ncbi:MAG: MBL fold metallo-hydrolase [Chloroflexi bacterium]|nr:MAG: MBL fold metallo-hydrolase [Chloroflexota bacterium]